MNDKDRALALSAAGLNDEAVAAVLNTDLDTVKRLSTDLNTIPAAKAKTATKTALGLTLNDPATYPLPVTDGIEDSGVGLDFESDSGLALVAFRATIEQPADALLPQLLLDGEVVVGDGGSTAITGPFVYWIQADLSWNSAEDPPPVAAGALLLNAEPGEHRLSFGYDSPDSAGSISDILIVVLPV